MPPSPSPSPTFVHTNKRGLELTPPQQTNAGKSETDQLLTKEVPNAVKMARYERSLWVDEAAKLAASKHSVKLLELVANEMTCCHWNLCLCCPIVCCEIPRATDPSGSTPRSPPPSP